jgi:hypothetical protein
VGSWRGNFVKRTLIGTLALSFVLLIAAAVPAQGGQPASLTLSPAQATNPVGTTHTITATLLFGGDPGPGYFIDFVTSGANPNAQGTCSPDPDCITDQNGQVSFTYTGPNAGVDAINACAFGKSSTPFTCAAAVSKTWVAPATPAPPAAAVAPASTKKKKCKKGFKKVKGKCVKKKVDPGFTG